MRAFVGIGVPEPHRGALRGHLDVCARGAPGFRWIPADNLHLTLRFLGNVSPSQREAIASGLRSIQFEPFQIRLGAAGSFGRGSSARVAWMGVSMGQSELAALAELTERACRSAGIEPEQRRFNPHLTLARSRDRQGGPLPDLPPAPQLPPWTVAAFCLYQSRTGPAGAAYSVLERFPGPES